MALKQFLIMIIFFNFVTLGCLANVISQQPNTATNDPPDRTTSQTLLQSSEMDETRDVESTDTEMTMMGYVKKMNMTDRMLEENSIMSTMNYLNTYDSQRSMQDHKKNVTMEMAIDVSDEPKLKLVSSDSIEDVNRTELMNQVYKFAGCKTYPQVIRIPNDQPNVGLHPSSILMDRCGGSCSHSAVECTPTATQEVLVKVVKYVFLGDSVVDTVKVTKHTACQCMCKVQESHCTAAQEYDDYNCRCVCRNEAETRSCSLYGREWNSYECECQCHQSQIRSCLSFLGFIFNSRTCQCECHNEAESRSCHPGKKWNPGQCECQCYQSQIRSCLTFPGYKFNPSTCQCGIPTD